MHSPVKLKPRELALSKLCSQYEDLDMWIHNYLPHGDISEIEKQHLRDVMLRDQVLKKNDTERIRFMTRQFPAKLRPEILSTSIETLRQQNPAVPGSGLVSLCAPVTLNGTPPSALLSASYMFPSEPYSGSNRCGPKEPDLSTRPVGKDRCPFCYARLGIFRQRRTCEQCQQVICGRCISQPMKDVFLCKDCLDMAKVVGKTGDWFARYLTSKPPNPLKMGVAVETSPSSRKREFRSKVDQSPESPRPTLAQNRTSMIAAKGSPVDKRKSWSAHLNRQSTTESRLDRPVNYATLDGTPVRNLKSASPPASARHSREENFLGQVPLHIDENDNQEAADTSETKALDVSSTKRQTKETRFDNKQPSTLKKSPEVDSAYQTCVAIQGEIELSLDYDSQQGRLAIILYGAKNIAAADRKTGTSNPVARVLLEPDQYRSTERKLSCKEHTCSPIFNQGICYSVSPSEIGAHTVVVELWHKKARGGKLFLGEAAVPLHDYKWYDRQKKRLTLRDKSAITTALAGTAYMGEVCLGLKFVLSEAHKKLAQLTDEVTDFPGILEVHANGASNLRSQIMGTNVTAFLRVSLIVEGKEVETRSTYPMPKSNRPRWNTVLRFEELEQSDLVCVVLQISVWNQSNPTIPAEFLGGIRLGRIPVNRTEEWQACSPEEYRLWTDFIGKSDQHMTATLPLHDL